MLPWACSVSRIENGTIRLKMEPELLEQLEQFIKEQDTAYSCIIKVEQSYTAAHK